MAQKEKLKFKTLQINVLLWFARPISLYTDLVSYSLFKKKMKGFTL
ncbi:MAG: hypothetical protein BWX51_00374 [Bacteroidetes bacterium ADurb.Bin012]|jgi:hypothetical protein|nr:MAG: hypothetical protein BWX51_00374 [Bacteroidetes bacterium ADurb.Bin012]